jgi:putative transposase
MPRRQRLDFKDAVQYVRLRGRDGKFIFFDPAILQNHGESPRQHAPGVRRFEALLAATCEECAATLLAYCVEPNAAWLVLQTGGAPLMACMRRLSGQYSRSTKFPIGGSPFAARYVSQVVAPEYFPYAVRRTHRRPIETGLCRRRSDYPFSSERAYLGERATLPLDCNPVRTELQQKGYFGSRGYREFMDQDDTPYIAKLFSNGSPQDPRVVGSKSYVQRVRYMATHPPSVPTREQLIEAVAQLLQTTAAELFAATRVGVLGRALVAWYGLRSGAATLTEMGGWFSISGATLGQALHHHRRKNSTFFKLCEMPQARNEPLTRN